MLKFDAMTLGNHEFDDGVKGLTPFLRNQTVPFVVSNIDITETPELAGLYTPSVVLEVRVGGQPRGQVGGRRVGVVGYLTPETQEVSNPGKLVIKDELAPVTAEVERLHKDGVDIIIGLGHSGYQKVPPGPAPPGHGAGGGRAPPGPGGGGAHPLLPLLGPHQPLQQQDRGEEVQVVLGGGVVHGWRDAPTGANMLRLFGTEWLQTIT